MTKKAGETPAWFEPEKPQVDRIFDNVEMNRTLLEACENGLIKTKIVDEVAIQRLAKDIYRGWKSGVRELLANEFRALRTTKKQYGVEGELTVSIDTIKNQMVIWGKNSLGIGVQKFLDVLRVVGRSDNFDEEEIGYFGMGFLAYTTIADTIKLETFSRETGERFAVLGREALAFEVIPADEDFKDYGTRLTIPYRVTASEIELQVMEVCRFQNDLKVTLTIDGEVRPFETRPFEAVFELAELAVKNRQKFEDEDLVLVCGRIDSYRNRSQRVRVFNHGIYLCEAYAPNLPNGPEEMVFAVNIKNERKYKPMPSRDDLTEEAKEKIGYVISARFAAMVAEAAEQEDDTYAAFELLAFMAANHAPLPEKHAEAFAELQTEYEVFIKDSVNYCRSYDRKLVAIIAHIRSKDDTKWRHRAIIAEDTEKTRKLMRESYSCLIVADTPEKADLLKKYGVGSQTPIDYAKTLVPCYTADGMKRVRLSDLTSKHIHCGDDAWLYKVTLGPNLPYSICKLNKKQKKIVGSAVMSIKEFARWTGEQKVLTLTGHLTVSEALADTEAGTPILTPAFNLKAAEVLMRASDAPKRYLVGEPGLIQAVACYCIYHKIKYEMGSNSFDLKLNWGGHNEADPTTRKAVADITDTFLTDKRMYELKNLLAKFVGPAEYFQLVNGIEEWLKKHGSPKQDS